MHEGQDGAGVVGFEIERDGAGAGADVGVADPTPRERHPPVGLDLDVLAFDDVATGDIDADLPTGPRVRSSRSRRST